MVTASSATDRTAAKAALLEAIAALPCPTGMPELSNTIEPYAAALEALNPTPVPTQAAELLTGNWRTLYTTSQDLLKLGRVIPGFKSGGIYQCVWADKGLLCNVAEINGLPYLGGIVAVRATFTAVGDRRVKVNFTQAMIGSQTIMNYDLDSFLWLMERNPDQLPALKIAFSETREQKGWLDVTYLDDDLRIGRGNEGSLFVLAKVSSTSPPELS